MSSSRALTLAIIGAGRTGRALGKLLHNRGWRIGAVVTRSAATARAAVRAIGAGKPLVQFTPEVFAADVILVTTPDSTIAATATHLASVAAGLPRHLSPAGSPRHPSAADLTLHSVGAHLRVRPHALHGKIVLHTSGALDSRVLAPLARCGAAIGSMHPFQTFGARAIPNLKGVLFTMEGDPHALRVARRIARLLGGVPIVIPARAKPAYHAAGGFAAAHMLALAEAATQLLVALGFPRRRAQRGLLCMARETLDNLEALGPQASWTGPVSRGDLSTVQKHVAALRRFPPEFRAAHAAMLLLSARVLAADKGARLRRLKRILEETPQ